MTRKICIGLVVALLVPGVTAMAQGIGTPFGSSAENPGISVVGDVLARYDNGESDWWGGLGDLELGFQAPVDPYGRVDVLLHYSAGLFGYGHEHEEGGHSHGSGFAVEEALISLTSLPYGFQTQVGRMRSRIGIANVVHLHDFNFVEYPRVITDYWGHEGLPVDGIRVPWLSPLPVWTEVVFEGQRTLDEESPNYATLGLDVFIPSGDDFGLMLTGFGYNDKPVHHEHHDEEDEKHALASEKDEDHAEEGYGWNGWGAGLRFKWKPAARAMYTHFIIQAEYMNRKFEGENHGGYYLFGEYLFARRWAAGAMYQNIELPHHDNEHEHDEKGEHEEKTKDQWLNLALSFWVSEFQRVRLQFDNPIDIEELDYRVSLQWTFVLGPHKPHSY